MSARLKDPALLAARRILRLIERSAPHLNDATRDFLLDKLICKWMPDGGELANVTIDRKDRP